MRFIPPPAFAIVTPIPLQFMDTIPSQLLAYATRILNPTQAYLGL